MKFILFFLITCISVSGFTQGSGTKKVLFLGNSYTYVNNLPVIVSDLATANEDTLEVISNTLGGYTLQMHCSNAVSLMEVQQPDLDFLVLQEQSQIPSFPIAEVDTLCFPYAHYLDSLYNVFNPCGETMFYMTWGRKNGDASNCAIWPPVCTYEGMDSLLRLRYTMMADSNNAVLSPVGAVWHYIRHHYPAIELYASDESHPSPAGSYAAACTFYTCIFRKSPLNIPFDYTLNAIDAGIIRYAATKVVYDSLLKWKIGKYDPHAGFLSIDHPNFEIEFVNTSQNANHFHWDFGDGTDSYNPIVSHQYPAAGTYIVTLVASNCNVFDTVIDTIQVLPLGLNENNEKGSSLLFYPNPVDDEIHVNAGADIQEIQIFNAIGSQILQRKISLSGVQTISLSGLSDGRYYLKLVSSKEKERVVSFIKEGR